MTKEQALENKIRVQKEGGEAWFNSNGIGALEWCTGVGKTKASLDILDRCRGEWLQQYDSPLQTIIITPTEEMRDIDWPEEFVRWNISQENVKIVCYSSYAKQDLSKYDLIILDEYHKMTEKNLLKLQDATQNKRLMLLALSATLPSKIKYEEDRGRIELMRSLIPTVHKITVDEAVDLGLVANFEIFVLKFFLDAFNSTVLAGSKVKPFKQTEKAAYSYLTKNVQRSMYAKNPNFKFVAISKRMNFMYNLPSKLKLAKKILEKIQDENKRTVVFAGSIDQANELCGQHVYHSESSRDALEKFQRKEISLLGAVKALNEGKNLTEPDQAIIVQVDSVDRNLVQRIGRIIRIRYNNMQFKARIIILVAANTVDETWYESAIKDFETSRIQINFVQV